MSVAIVSLLAAASASAQPVPPVRLNVSTAGAQANGSSFFDDMTLDGRVVVFESSASNLVEGDTNGQFDVFVRDRDTDRDGVLDEPGAVRTIRVSQGPAGEQPGLISGSVRVSSDGRFVFWSTSAALVAADTNGHNDGYVYDRDVDADGVFDEPGFAGLSLATTGSGNSLATGGDSYAYDLSTDGRYLLFTSRAANLTPHPVNGERFYRKDRLTSLTVLVSGAPDGTPIEGLTRATMSASGRLVLLSGFSDLEPISPPVGASPWLLQDLEANTSVSIPWSERPASVLPVRAAAGAVVAEPYFYAYTGVAGFSPDERRAYVTYVIQGTGGTAQTSGTTFEYDIAAGAITRALPGVPPTGSIDGRDGLGFSILRTTGVFGTFDASRYVLATGRVSTVVPGRLCSFDSAGDRSLFLAGTCMGSPLLLDERYGVPLPMPAPVQPGRLDAAGSMVVFWSADATILPAGADTNGEPDIFAVDLLSRLDRDGDGLDDRWEVAMGLDYASSAGTDGATGDPDGDGRTNLQEQADGSHPRGTAREFLAEGADNAFFKTRLAIANPGTAAATAVVRLDGDDGTARTVNVHVPAGTRRTVFVDEIAGHAPSFATVVDSSAPLIAERTMSWDATEYGAHAERASGAPSTSWFLAEGATGSFSLFYLLQNPGDTAATATVRYLRPSPLAPLDRTYTLPPHSRATLPVNTQAPELADTDVSASISATQPIFVERAMYRSVGGQIFAAGHASAGVTAAATSWFLAEGATGDFFDLFVLIANPSVTDATVEIRYLLTTGQVLTKSYTVAAESRRTIYVDGETFPGLGQALVNTTLSCAITSTNAVPIVVERSMWFPGPAVTPAFWTEAHNSPGTTTTATRWVLADGESGGTRGAQTFVLIANTSSTPGRVRVTQLPDAHAPVDPAFIGPITITVDLPANSRTTVPLHAAPGFADRRYGVLVESIDTAPLAELVVERAMYWNAGGTIWAAGTNLLATPIP